MQMEELTALKMREELREYLKPFRGCSVYFSEKDEALFYCRINHSLDRADIERTIDDIVRIGYTTEWSNGNLKISPQNVYIEKCVQRLLQTIGAKKCGLYSARLMMHPLETITEDGRKLILRALRLAKWANTGSSNKGKPNKVSARLELKKEIRDFRQECALLLRRRDYSGLYECGVFFSELERTEWFVGK